MLFIVNIFRRGWVLPVLAVGLWVLVAVIGGASVPALVQRFRVQPAESSLEAPYIEDNIAATRQALRPAPDEGIALETSRRAATSATEDLVENADILRNVRLWDPTQQILGRDLRWAQDIRSYLSRSTTSTWTATRSTVGPPR